MQNPKWDFINTKNNENGTLFSAVLLLSSSSNIYKIVIEWILLITEKKLIVEFERGLFAHYHSTFLRIFKNWLIAD